MYLLTLCSTYVYPIDEKVREEYKAYETKNNRTNAIAVEFI
jgi:hypothetical protein